MASNGSREPTVPLEPGDWVIVRYDDGTTSSEGTVRVVNGGWVEIELDGGVCDEYHPDCVELIEKAAQHA